MNLKTPSEAAFIPLRVYLLSYLEFGLSELSNTPRDLLCLIQEKNFKPYFIELNELITASTLSWLSYLCI